MVCVSVGLEVFQFKLVCSGIEFGVMLGHAAFGELRVGDNAQRVDILIIRRRRVQSGLVDNNRAVAVALECVVKRTDKLRHGEQVDADAKSGIVIKPHLVNARVPLMLMKRVAGGRRCEVCFGDGAHWIIPVGLGKFGVAIYRVAVKRANIKLRRRDFSDLDLRGEVDFSFPVNNASPR